MKTFNIVELELKINSDYLKQELRQKLELAILVDLNYDSIVHLEQLRDSMKSGLGEYYKRYHPELEYFTITISELIENTRSNHYKRPNEKMLPNIHSVYKHLFGNHHIIGKRKPIF